MSDKYLCCPIIFVSKICCQKLPRISQIPYPIKVKVVEQILQFSSVAQSCLTLCDPVDCNMPGFPVHRQLPELAQTHVDRVGDAIQPSHPLLSPCPPAFNLSQHQGLFFFFFSGSFQMSQLSASGGQSIGVSPSTSVPPMNTRTDLYYSGPHYFYIALLK